MALSLQFLLPVVLRPFTFYTSSTSMNLAFTASRTSNDSSSNSSSIDLLVQTTVQMASLGGMNRW